MQHQIGNCGITLLVGVVIGDVLGDQIVQLDGIAASKVHHCQGRGHDFSQRCDVVLGAVGDLNIVKLIAIAQISKVFIVNDVGLVSYSHAAAGKGTLVYH